MKKLFVTTLLAGLCATSAIMAAPTSNAPTTMPNTTASNFSPQQVDAIQKIVHDYLVNNPQVLVEASQALQKQAQEKQDKFAQQAIRQHKQQLFNDPASPIVGNVNGAVTLVEFFDYQCGHCKAMTGTIAALVKKNPSLRIVFKELPIFGSASQLAAKAALASMAQGKYYAFHEALLKADNPLTQAKIYKVAKSVGLNVAKLKKGMKSGAVQKQLKDNFQLAQSLHLVGTPTFVLSNKAQSQFRFIPGATTQDNLQQLIGQLAK